MLSTKKLFELNTPLEDKIEFYLSSIVERKFSENNNNLSIGLANIHAIVPDIEQNKINFINCINEFKKKNVNMILFPEFCLTGYFWGEDDNNGSKDCWDYMETGVTDNHYEWIDNEILPLLDDTLQFIIFNNIRKGPSKKYYNSTFILNKQIDYKNPEFIYDKTFLPGIENIYTESGKTDRVILDTKWGRFGFSTCYDFCFSQLYQEMARIDKVDAVIQLSSWRATGRRDYSNVNVYTDTYYKDLWNMLMDGTAARNQIWIIACNAVGIHPISKAIFCGSSGIWAPSGLKLIQSSDINEELTILHNIDIKEQIKFEKDDFDYKVDFQKIYKDLSDKRTFTRIN
jgi:predicted amidohydrolase